MTNEKDTSKQRSPVSDVNANWRYISQIIGAADSVEAGLYSSHPELRDGICTYPEISLPQLRNYRITSLGTEKPTAGGKKNDGAEQKCRSFAGSLLSSGSEQGFSVFCHPDGETGLSFGIGSADGPDRIRALLDSAFGSSELHEDSSVPEFSEEWQALCAPVIRAKEENEKPEDKIKNKWVDAVIPVLMNSDCGIRLDFIPADRAWVSAELDRVYKKLELYVKYLSTKGQLSSNFGESSTSTASANKIISIHKKSSSENSGSTASINLSKDVSVVDPRAENAEKLLRDRAMLLEKMASRGWFIRVSVFSSSLSDSRGAALRDILSGVLLSMNYSCTWKRRDKTKPDSAVLAGLCLPAADVLPLVSVPTKDFPGFSSKESNGLNLNPPSPQNRESGDLALGRVLWNGRETGKELCIPRSELNRHTFVCGMTGSGKTNTVCSLLSSLDDLNFIVIEPVKGEYHSIPNTRRFNMVAGSEHSLYMNPFRFPRGGSLQYHIDSLKLIISSAFDLYAAMPNILEQCLYRVYMNCGWDLISGNNIYRDELPEEELYPTFASLCAEVEQYISEKFQGELQDNYRGALLSRLQSFTGGSKGVLLNTTAYIPFEEWAEQNVVIELDALADDADKAIVMGALLVQYFQFVKNNTSHRASDGLRHLFVLEEAHHLFQESPPSGGNGQSSSAQLVKMLGNLLAEIRAYGEGFLIVDQSPSALSPSVLKNTAVKIAHRVDYGEDIRLLSSVLLLDSDEKTTASLKCGEALVRFGSMTLPSHVGVYLCREKEECVLHGHSATVPSVSTAYDRILMNEALTDVLSQAGKMYLTSALFEKDFRLVGKCFNALRDTVTKLIVYHCGWENAAIFSDKLNFLPLLNVCISKASGELFPGQYCLSKMSQMFVKRLSEFFADRESAGLTDAEAELFSDYREKRLYPRISFFYENSGDAAIQRVTELIGSFPEAGVVKQLADGVWSAAPEIRDELFAEKLREVFGMTPGRLTKDYLKYLTDIYVKESSAT